MTGASSGIGRVAALAVADAGESLTIEPMKVALRYLTTAIDYDVAEQDLRVRLSRMPAQPNSRFVLSNVRRIS